MRQEETRSVARLRLRFAPPLCSLGCLLSRLRLKQVKDAAYDLEAYDLERSLGALLEARIAPPFPSVPYLGGARLA